MIDNELEFAISQYIDGTLPPLEAARVEEILAVNPEARAIFASYQRLNETLRRDNAPDVDWDAFSARISAEISSEDPPAISYRIGVSRITRFVGLAAAIMVLIGLVALLARDHAVPDAPEISIAHGGAGGSGGTIQIAGPAIELSATPVAQISIGPAQGYEQPSIYLAEAVVSRPARVVIASAARSAQDSGDSPY